MKIIFLGVILTIFLLLSTISAEPGKSRRRKRPVKRVIKTPKTPVSHEIDAVVNKGKTNQATYRVNVKSTGDAKRRSSYELTLIDKKKNGHTKIFPARSKYITYIMFNPSNADSITLDATVKKLIQITDQFSDNHHDVGSFKILNLYEQRSPDPKLVNVNKNDPITWDDVLEDPKNVAIVKAWGSLRATEQGVRDRKAKVNAYLEKNLKTVNKSRDKNKRVKLGYLGTENEGKGKTYHPKAFAWGHLRESGKVPPITFE